MTTNLQLDKLIENTGNFKKMVSKKTKLATGIQVEIKVFRDGKIKFRETKSFPYTLDGYHDGVKWKNEITTSVKIGKPINLIKAEGITLDKAIELADTDSKEGWQNCQPDYRVACIKSLSRFSDFVGHKRNLRTIGADDMESFSQELLRLRKVNKKGEMRKLTFRTLNQQLLQIGKVFNLAFRRGYLEKQIIVPKFDTRKQPPIDKRPFRFVEQNGTVLVNEEQDFYDACNKRGGVFNEFAMIVQFACHTGLREMEIINSRINWISWEEKVLRLPAAITKAKKVREVALNPIAYQIAKYFVNGRNKKANIKLFVSHYPAVLKRERVAVHGDGGMFKWFATKLRHYFANIKQDLGIEDDRLTFHSTRHTAITRLINSPSKPSIFEVKEWIGHADVDTTYIYWQKEAQANSTLSNEILLHPANANTISNKDLFKNYNSDKNVIALPFHDGEGQWKRNPRHKHRHEQVVATNRRLGTVGRAKTFSKY